MDKYFGIYSFDRDSSYFAVKFSGSLVKAYVKVCLDQPMIKEQIFEIDLSNKFQGIDPSEQKLFTLTFNDQLNPIQEQGIPFDLQAYPLPYQKYKYIEVFFVFQAFST